MLTKKVLSCSCTAGHLVSSYVKHHLPLILVRELNRSNNLEKVLTDCFHEVDRNMIESPVDCEFSGTTAVVGFLKVLHHTSYGVVDLTSDIQMVYTIYLLHIIPSLLMYLAYQFGGAGLLTSRLQ